MQFASAPMGIGYHLESTYNASLCNEYVLIEPDSNSAIYAQLRPLHRYQHLPGV